MHYVGCNRQACWQSEVFCFQHLFVLILIMPYATQAYWAFIKTQDYLFLSLANKQTQSDQSRQVVLFTLMGSNKVSFPGSSRKERAMKLWEEEGSKVFQHADSKLSDFYRNASFILWYPKSSGGNQQTHKHSSPYSWPSVAFVAF